MSDEDDLLIDREELRAQRDKLDNERAAHEKYLEDLRCVIAIPGGRRIMWDLLGGMGFQRDLFNIDPLIMAMNCGQHKLAIALVKDLEEAMPGIYARMTNEFRSTKENRNA